MYACCLYQYCLCFFTHSSIQRFVSYVSDISRTVACTWSARRAISSSTAGPGTRSSPCSSCPGPACRSTCRTRRTTSCAASTASRTCRSSPLRATAHTTSSARAGGPSEQRNAGNAWNTCGVCLLWVPMGACVIDNVGDVNVNVVCASEFVI